MITSEQISLLYELRQTPIPEPTLVELEARFQHRIHSIILDAFSKSGLTQKELAERLRWNRARVSRLLAAASNLTLGTISALLAGIGVDLDDLSYTSFDELERRLKGHYSTTVAEPLMNQLNMPADPLSPVASIQQQVQVPKPKINPYMSRSSGRNIQLGEVANG